MTRVAPAVLLCLLLWTMSRGGAAAPREASAARGGSAVTAATRAWVVDFADYAGGPIEAWLRAKGFRPEHGAEDPTVLALTHHAGALVLEAKQPVRGFLVNDQVKLAHASRVRITWGVIKYPAGASYERQINNEALMLYISFGEDAVPSGHVLIPARPYFIGLFLGQEERLHTPFRGQYFHEGGRFVCVGNPPPSETVTSEFDLRTAFRTYFAKADVPMISGVSLGVDTFASGERGTAAAYIHRRCQVNVS
jgi:hypothetical protein